MTILSLLTSYLKYIITGIVLSMVFWGGCSLGAGNIQSKLEKANKAGYSSGRKDGIIKGYNKGYDDAEAGKRRLQYPELWLDERDNSAPDSTTLDARVSAMHTFAYITELYPSY